MSDEVQETDTTETTDGVEHRKLSYEELEAELSRTRREAASKRISVKAKEAELDEFKQWKESQKTELQRLSDRAAEAEREAADVRRENMQIKAAKKAGLDLDLAVRLIGDSEEEMLEDAQQLVERASKQPRMQTTLSGGARGKPVGSGAPETESDWFRKQFSES